MAKVIREATAAQVRQFFTENKALIPAEAAQSLRPGARGRLHPAAVEAFNKQKRTTGMEYREGAVAKVTLHYPAKDSRGRSITKKAHLPMQEVRRLAGPFAGKRGMLSEHALAFAGEQFASLQK